MKVALNFRTSRKSAANMIQQRLLDRLNGTRIEREQWVPADCDMLIQWGAKPTLALRSAFKMKIPFVILDMGYFDAGRINRQSISINGHHGLSMAVPGVEKLSTREHPIIQPWRTEDPARYIYVLGQMPGDSSLRGMDIEAWMNRAAGRSIEAYGRKVIKRGHPKELNDWEARLPALDTLYDDAFMFVTYSSTAAVQAVLAGVPCVAEHPSSPAYDVCAAAPDKGIRMPDREQWAHELSHREYALLDDADCDKAVEYILRGYPRAKRRAQRGEIDRIGIRHE